MSEKLLKVEDNNNDTGGFGIKPRSMRPGSAQALRENDESFNSSQIKTSDEDDILFARTRGDTFKHAYCDYDISDMVSSVGNYSSVNSVQSESSVLVVKDERWYDKSSSAYFTSDATRNA